MEYEEAVVLKTATTYSSNTSSTSSATSIVKAEAISAPVNAWEGYQDIELSDKAPKVARNLRHLVFSVYRRLFGVVFAINMAIFISIIARGGTNSAELGTIVVANLFSSILMRQEYVVNAFFIVFCAVPAR
jgi:hypothetical protein